MAITETCGSCGSSIDLDRNDEVQLWRDWQKNHKCQMPVKDNFFSSASPQVEAASIGFVIAEHPGRRDTGLDE